MNSEVCVHFEFRNILTVVVMTHTTEDRLALEPRK
jgi:hypothetical protein